MGDEPTPQQLLERALALHSAGSLDEADRVYESLEAVGFASPDVLHLRGVLAYQRGLFDIARARIERAVAEDGTDPSYHSNLGIVRKAQGDLEAAVESFRTALGLAPDFLDARNNLGTVLKSLGRLPEAADEFRAVIALEPSAAPAYNNLGAVERSLGHLDAAESAYSRAIELDPRYADAHHNLGNLRLQREQFEQAVQSFEAALAIGGESPETFRLLAVALERVGRVEDAVAACERACTMAPQNERLWDQLGSLLQRTAHLDATHPGAANPRTHDLEKAKAAFCRALALAPKDRDANFHLATIHQETGNTRDALRGYEHVLSLDPSFVPAHRALGKLLYGLGDVEGALEAYRSWAALDPGDPEARYLIAACSQDDVPSRSPAEFVSSHYDQFARDFDRQLARLGYCGPDLVARALEPHRPAPGDTWSVLDAGCGTGLSGIPLAPMASRLVGVDLSEKMLDRARARGIYHELEACDLTTYLAEHRNEFDLVVAADAIIYFGALEEFFWGVANALRADGLFVFTAEDAGAVDDSLSGRGFVLQPSGRFAHSKGYLLRMLEQCGLRPLELSRAVLRSEVNRDVQAWVVLAARRSYRGSLLPEDFHGTDSRSDP